MTVKTVMAVYDHYALAALWTSTDDDGEPLDGVCDVQDIADATREAMLSDVLDFLTACWDDGVDLSSIEPEQIGHDFWLTRNGHGAGFWDRGLGTLGDDLTTRSHAYGEFILYVGDDHLIHH